MKIAHILDSLEIGGAEKLVVTLAEIQRRHGHQVQVHCLVRKGPLEKTLAELGVPLYPTDATGLVRSARALYKSFRQTRPDVVHAHNRTATIYASIGARAADVPAIVSTRHGLPQYEQAQSGEVKFWLTARLGMRIVGVSEKAREGLVQFPLSIPGLVDVIINGAAPGEEKADAPRLTVKDGEFWFIHVARLNEVKDQPTLIRAFAEVYKSAPHARLVIVGDGPKRGEVEALIRQLGVGDAVLLAGSQTYVGNWLKPAHCFVLSSRSEGTPISLLEALAAGLPCVVTAVGEMPAIVERSHCGLLVPPRSSAELGRAMLQMVQGDPKWRAELAANAKEVYEKDFSPETMAERYSVIYEAEVARGLARHPS
jgi:glycosyltransferase involved in cell wall biosynthesis